MNNRIETFCDGIFAIAITLLILEIKVPAVYAASSNSDVWHYLVRLWPSFFALMFSFVIILIAWMGHHNLLKLINKSSPQFMLANGYFMFTIILIPFSTAFMAEYLDTPYAQPAILFYCCNAMLHNLGWIFLNRSVIKPMYLIKDNAAAIVHSKASKNGRYGLFLYAFIAILAYWLPYVALMINVTTWIFWLVFISRMKYTEEL